MNPTDLTLEAAAMITSSGKGDTGKISDLNAPQKRRVANDLTATMQLIYSIAPGIYKRSVGADFGDPVTASITVTDGSDVVTTAYAFGEGCSLYVGGAMNEIRTEGGVKRLRYPYTGQSGAQSAVFYQDCKILDPSIAKVIGPLSIASLKAGSIGRGDHIRKLDNRDDAERLRLRSGVPIHYWIEPFLLTTANEIATVTGTLSPDVTGVYVKTGTDANGYPFYVKTGAPTSVLFVDGSLGNLWHIGPFGDVDNVWTGSGTSLTNPTGSYAPGSPATGTANVTVETNTGQQSTLRLRLVPVPAHRLTISYDVTLRAPKFTVADLGTDSVPSTKSLTVAEDYHELFVRPIFLQMFTSSAWFKGDKNLRERLAEDDKQARSLLREYRAQQESNRRISAI